MLTIQELNKLLKLNEFLTHQAISDNNTMRLIELDNHRSIVKDMLIEELINQNNMLIYQDMSKNPLKYILAG